MSFIAFGGQAFVAELFPGHQEEDNEGGDNKPYNELSDVHGHVHAHNVGVPVRCTVIEQLSPVPCCAWRHVLESCAPIELKHVVHR